MGQLILFSVAPIYSRIAAETPKIETAKEAVGSMTNGLETALDLPDQMAAKMDQMQGLLPGGLKSGFGKRQRKILGQIDLVRSKAASFTDFSQKLLER
jgi:hypothetical protein